MPFVQVGVCTRCGVTPTPDNVLDRLTLYFDADIHPTTYVDLCRRCSQALAMWLSPPEAVRAGWASRRAGRET